MVAMIAIKEAQICFSWTNIKQVGKIMAMAITIKVAIPTNLVQGLNFDWDLTYYFAICK